MVLDDEGSPVGEAMVSANGASRAHATADAAGRFVLEGLEPGRYTLQAYAVDRDPPRTRRGVLEVELVDGLSRPVEIRLRAPSR